MTEKDKKEEFYQQLSEATTTVKKRDVLIVMGDMNAKIVPNNEGLEHVMGRHGIGNMNENDELFSELSRTVPGSILGGVTEDFFRGTPDRTMCPEVDSASESEYQGFLLE